MKTLEILKQIYANKKYYLLTLIVALLSFIVFYKLMLAKITNHSLKIFIMMSGYNYTYFTLLSFVMISVLFGVFLSLAVYKFKLIKTIKEKKGNSIGFFGYLGLVAGVFGAGCPTCGSVVFALFGAPLALMYLPFKGAELRVLSVLILIVSIYFLTKSLDKCDLKKRYKRSLLKYPIEK